MKDLSKRTSITLPCLTNQKKKLCPVSSIQRSLTLAFLLEAILNREGKQSFKATPHNVRTINFKLKPFQMKILVLGHKSS